MRFLPFNSPSFTIMRAYTSVDYFKSNKSNTLQLDRFRAARQKKKPVMYVCSLFIPVIKFPFLRDNLDRPLARLLTAENGLRNSVIRQQKHKSFLTYSYIGTGLKFYIWRMLFIYFFCGLIKNHTCGSQTGSKVKTHFLFKLLIINYQIYT